MAHDKSAYHDSPKKESSTPLNAKKAHKRKRESDGSPIATSTSTPTKKAKKNRALSPAPDPPKEKRSKEKRKKVSASEDVDETKAREESAVSAISSKAIAQSSDGKKSKSKKASKSGKRRTSESVDKTAHLNESGDDSGSKSGRDQSEAKKLRKKSKREDISQENDDTKADKNKFSGILSKFERSAKLKAAAKAKDTDGEPALAGPITAEPVVAQGLEPLPQPEQVLEEPEKPSYSSLPEWLANPLRESSDKRAQFSELGLNSNLLRVLGQNGYKEAFAVQSTVIPLLLQGPKRHAGDLCISAATGSGKTLSYVLPLVTALDPTPAPRMRGLIVVPTRELVKQAREACELCAAGSGLRVGSAVGNVAIKDEQRTLMRIDQCYGPEISKQRQTVDLAGEDWTKFNLLDYIAESGDLTELLPGYVEKAEPNVDILICTPGRLVDHLRYTKGFTLEHLEWLVIDEADRLLNESFQEWVDVVMSSLDARKSPKAFGSSGQFMAELGLPIQVKDPRKVILSATMTRDVSKLNSLRLANPKLVIVSSVDPTSTEDGGHIKSDEQFTIPRTLKEFSVSVGDGSQKPLYLLSLLRSHINVVADEQRSIDDSMDMSDSEDTGSDDTSSDGSDSDDTSSDDSNSEHSSSDDSDSDESDSGPSEEDSLSSDESDTSSDESIESESEEDAKSTTRGPTRNTVLIFTKSSESASRLSRLISLLDRSLANQVGTIIKSNKSSASRKTLTAYRRGKISIIVATDRASRGLDLQSLTHVVNYDVPPSVTTYVHRVGRTARAGKKGSAWTLVAHREGRWFDNEISKGSDGKITRSTKVERVNVGLGDMADMKSRYRTALDALEKEVQRGGTIKPTAAKV